MYIIYSSEILDACIIYIYTTKVLSQYSLSQCLLLGDMCTLPVSAQVATMWPACGMARTRFTPPGCGVALDLTTTTTTWDQ